MADVKKIEEIQLKLIIKKKKYNIIEKYQILDIKIQ
jgi:hypothetical protein